MQLSAECAAHGRWAVGCATLPVRKACRRAASATAAPRGDRAPAAAAAAAVGVLAASGLPNPAWQLLQKCLPTPGRSLQRRGERMAWPPAHARGTGLPLPSPPLETCTYTLFIHTEWCHDCGQATCCRRLRWYTRFAPAVPRQACSVRPHAAPLALHHVCGQQGRTGQEGEPTWACRGCAVTGGGVPCKLGALNSAACEKCSPGRSKLPAGDAVPCPDTPRSGQAWTAGAPWPSS